MKAIRIIGLALGIVLHFGTADACTSMIVGAKASKSGRPLLWKNRDTGTEQNFVERVPAKQGQYAYVALYNGGDSLLRDAWMGMNERGFAIMNTASYNLAPDTAKFKDQEGYVMSRALKVCETVNDFRILLDTLPKPMGVQANFGVIDAKGGAAYFECDDYNYTPFFLENEEQPVMIRTNYSFTGNDTDGMGYIRYENAKGLTKECIVNASFTPACFTEDCSKSFYHSLADHDFLADTTVRWVVDQDFIPRHSTSASVVVEGVNPGQDPSECVMWTVIGYPPVSHVREVRVDYVPEELRPTLPGHLSPACQETLRDKAKAFPIKHGSGQRYVDLDYLRTKIPAEKSFSEKEYMKHDKR